MPKREVLADLPVMPTPAEQLPPPSRATRRSVAKIHERKYLENIEPMLDEFYAAFRARMRTGNIESLRIGAQILNLIKGPGGINVTTQVLQQNSNNAQASAESGSRKSFAALVRKLDAREQVQTRASVADIFDVIPEQEPK